MDASGFRQPRRGSRFFVLLALILLVSPIGFVTARSLIRLDDPSPAVGRAQVVTQGISELPSSSYVMRVVKRIAPALGDAKVGRRVLGMALATDEPILITEVQGEDQFTDVARIAPGEAYLTKDGTRQIRASLSRQSASYISIEFVEPERAEEIGTGELLYVSPVLSTPPGQHDIDLVRNVLAQNDVASVPDTGGQILVLATDGAIDIVSERSGEQRLAAGGSAIFDAEPLDIRASDESVYGVPGNQLGSLTSMLQTDNPVAGYVVVVIGPEVPKTGDPTPTVTVSAQPTPSAEATATSPALGTIGVTSRLCDPGITVESISNDACPVLGSGFDLSLADPTGIRTLADAGQIDQTWYWSDLPLGQYAFAATAYPDGANDYFVPGSAAVAGSSASGYTVTIDPSAPDLIVTVYFLQPQAQPTTSLVIFEIVACQQGLVNCASPGQYDIDPQPYLVSKEGQTLTAADAQRSGDTYAWSLPAGTWNFYQEGWQSYYYVDGAVIEGGMPYVFVTDGASAQRHFVQDEIVVIN